MAANKYVSSKAGQRNTLFELFTVRDDDVGMVTLRSSCVVQSKRDILQTIGSGLIELEGIFKS